MLTRTRSHITRNVVGYLALFIALGGTSYGLASGSIDSREIKNDAVRTRDLRNNDVRSRDIRNRTIVARDVGNNELDGDQIDESGLAQVPSAISADTASNALSLGGQPASAVGRAPAAAVNFDNGDAGPVLAVPGLGTLQVAEPGCDIGDELVEVEFENTSDGALDFFAVPQYEELAPGETSPTVLLGDSGVDYVQLRVGAIGGGQMATLDVYFTPFAQGDQCRVSAQAVLSG